MHCHMTTTVASHALTSRVTLQFYLSERDIGKPRGLACVDKLARLNPAVKVHHVDSIGTTDKLNADLLKSFTVRL